MSSLSWMWRPTGNLCETLFARRTLKRTETTRQMLILTRSVSAMTICSLKMNESVKSKETLIQNWSSNWMRKPIENQNSTVIPMRTSTQTPTSTRTWTSKMIDFLNRFPSDSSSASAMQIRNYLSTERWISTETERQSNSPIHSQTTNATLMPTCSWRQRKICFAIHSQTSFPMQMRTYSQSMIPNAIAIQNST